MNGWIKIHKKILDWEWYEDSNAFRVFFHLLLSASWEDRRWKGIQVKRGQAVIGRTSLAKRLRLSEQQVRTSLERLKSTGEITIKTTNRFTLITVANYDIYQEGGGEITSKITSGATNNQPTNNQQITTSKESKTVRIKEEKTNTNTGFTLEQFLEDFNVIRRFYIPNAREIAIVDSKTKRQFSGLVKSGIERERMQQALRSLFADTFHREKRWKYCTPEFITRPDKFARFEMTEEAQAVEQGQVGII